MFNLEQTIADWRQQMLAAGIKAPAPLEELESHLRNEIERQMESGLNEQRAFAIASQLIGHASALENEFKKTTTRARYISQSFIYTMLVFSSVLSLAMLYLRLLRPAIDAARLASAFKSRRTSKMDSLATFKGNPLLDHTNFVSECLLLSLILTALFALISFHLSKPSKISLAV